MLVILTDDQRAGIRSASCSGNWASAPCSVSFEHNLDRLAAEGARFANVFVTTSLCSPRTRASLLRGRYARSHRVLNNFTEYPNDLPGYPGRLQAAGYETAYIGKWHMGEDNNEQQRPGFDYWMSHRGQGNYFDTEFNVNGTRRKITGYYTTVVTDRAVDWLKQPHEKPWLLVVGQKAPHGGPMKPEPRFAHALDECPVKKPANFGDYRAADGKPAWAGGEPAHLARRRRPLWPQGIRRVRARLPGHPALRG